MNKLVQYALITGLAVNLLIAPALVFAQTEPAPTTASIGGLLNETAGVNGAGYDVSTDSGGTGLARIVGSVARAFISLIGIIFVSYTIYGGYLWMMARGNEEQITKAKNIIRDGIIGIVIILSAGAIYYTIRELLLSGTTNAPGHS